MIWLMFVAQLYAMSQQTVNPAITRLEKQIYALERNMAESVVNCKPTRNSFALGNLIKKKKAELEKLKNFEWEAK